MNPPTTLHSLLVAYGAGPTPRETPAIPSPADVTRNPVIEDDVSSLLDADGETDHESAAEVFTVHVPKGPRLSGSTAGNDATVRRPLTI